MTPLEVEALPKDDLSQINKYLAQSQNFENFDQVNSIKRKQNQPGSLEMTLIDIAG